MSRISLIERPDDFASLLTSSYSSLLLTTPYPLASLHLTSPNSVSASATVEAALVMPLFIYAVTAVMYIMQMLSVQLHIQESLYNECRLLARYAYLSDCLQNGDDSDGAISSNQNVADAFPEKSILERGIDIAAVYALFIRETGADYAEKMYISGGNAGYIMTGSKIRDGNNDIELEVRYARTF